jgi:hypothetical protein
MTGADDLTNAGEVVEALGRAWTLAHVGPGVRGAFAAWLKGRARREVFAGRRDMGEDVFRESLASLNEQMAAGAYDWGSPLHPDLMGSAVEASLSRIAGMVRLVQLLLEPRHGPQDEPQVLALLNDAPEAFAHAVLACRGVRPNRQAPATSPGPANGTTTTPAPGPA